MHASKVSRSRTNPGARARPSVKLRDEKFIKPGCFILQRPIFLSSTRPPPPPFSSLCRFWLRAARVSSRGHSIGNVCRPLVSRGLSKNARTLTELLGVFSSPFFEPIHGVLERAHCCLPGSRDSPAAT